MQTSSLWFVGRFEPARRRALFAAESIPGLAVIGRYARSRFNVLNSVEIKIMQEEARRVARWEADLTSAQLSGRDAQETVHFS